MPSGTYTATWGLYTTSNRRALKYITQLNMNMNMMRCCDLLDIFVIHGSMFAVLELQ